jgi:hypothetical protein
MSGIIGSKLNIKGSGIVAKLGTDGQHLLSSGAGKSAEFETPPSATFDDTDIRQDLVTLAIHSAISDNKAAHNLPNSYIDQFEDSTDLNFTATTARASSGSDDFLVAGTAGPGPATYTSYATGSGTFTVPAGVTAFDVIVIGGGGASASSGNCGPTEAWGGGGAGGLVWRAATDTPDPGDTYAYSVGAGGAAGLNKGSNSTFDTGLTLITALGGGYGFNASHNAHPNGSGGSGGGGGRVNGNGAPGTQGDSGGGTGYGNDGGHAGSGSGSGGGGGGAGGNGSAGNSSNTGGAGGAPLDLSATPVVWNVPTYATGGLFAGGGGGGSAGGGAASASGGGGAGGNGTPGKGSNGTDGLGGGAGGGTGPTSYESAGGKGGIHIRYTPYTIAWNATGTMTSDTVAVPNASVDEVSGVLIYKDTEGTATLGTDIKVSFSCNGGTNFTECSTYTAVTTLATASLKMARLAKTTCTAGTAIQYKIVWANMSDGSKECEAWGIGLNY